MQNFRLDCSDEISPNLYFDRLLFWKCIKFQPKKVWRSYVSWHQRVIVCTSPLSAGKLSLQPNFQKGGGAWQDLNFRGRLLGKRGMTFFKGGGGRLQFLHKNKLKFEIFNDKKSLQAKVFFSVITKNSNWEILPKN